jgi:formimidoylglutamate deiminase
MASASHIAAETCSRATPDGTAALGVSPGLAVGLSADIVSLDLQHPSLAGKTGDRIVDALVFAAGRSGIDCVWRYGEKLVSQGRHHARAAAIARYRIVLEKLSS